MAGALQMIAVAPPLILLLMWLGQPGQSAALLGTAAAMSSTALVSRQLADQGELTTRHGRSAIAVLVFQDWPACPCWPCWRSGRAASRRRSSMCCLKYSVCCCCSRQRPSSRAVCCMACWAGWRGGATRNRSCSSPCAWWWLPPLLRTRSAYPPPGGLPRRDGAGRERLPAPHGKPPQAVSRCVVGRVLRDHRPATGRSTDSFGTAGGAGVAGGAGTGQDPAQYAGLAGDAPVRPRCLAHGHSVGARRR